MAVNVNVNVDERASNLLAKNKNQTQVNRQNKENKTRQRSLQEKAIIDRTKETTPSNADPNITATGQDASSAGSKPSSTQEELLAITRDRYIPVRGHYKWGNNFTVYSGNGQTSITKEIPITQIQDSDFDLQWDLTTFNVLNSSPTAGLVWPNGSPTDYGVNLYDMYPYFGSYEPSNGKYAASQFFDTNPFGYQEFRTTYRRDLQDSNGDVFCFPLNSTCFVLYLFFYVHKDSSYSGVKWKRTYQVKSLGPVLECDYFASCLPGRAIPAYTMDRTEEIVDSFSQTVNKTDVTEFCFLVGENFIKEINVPSALSQACSSLYPQLSSPVAIPQTALEDNLTSVFYALASPPSGVEPLTQTVTQEPYTITGYDTFAYDDLKDPREGTLYPSVDLDLIKAYGMHPASGNFREHFFAPSIYEMLINGEEIRLYEWAYYEPPYYETNFINYDYIYGNYLSQTPFPGIMLNMDEIGYPYFYTYPSPREQAYTDNFIDTYNSDLPDDTPFQQNLATSYAETEEVAAIKNFPVYADTVFTWNWNSESYCRAKLYELGFTLSDLTP